MYSIIIYFDPLNFILFFNFIKMQGLPEQRRRVSRENPEPFIVLKNVRK